LPRNRSDKLQIFRIVYIYQILIRKSIFRSLGVQAAVAKQDPSMIPLMVRWESKIVLITQAGSKYGFELCRVFCEAGMRVIAIGNSREDMARLQSMVVENQIVQPQNFLPVVCDTSKEGEVLSLRRIAQQRWPKASSVDILINLASLSKAESSLIEGSAANWADVLSGNLLGMLLCSREVIKAGSPLIVH